MKQSKRNSEKIWDYAGPRAAGQDAQSAERMEQLKELGVTGKAFSILEFVAARPGPSSMSEIIRTTAITKPSAHRVVNMLCDLGFVERDPAGFGFVSGLKLLELAHQTVLSSAPRGLRHSILEQLAQHVGETCNYGVMTGAQVTYLDRVESKWPLGLRFDAGSQVPAHCTAIGKLLLSHLSENQLLAITRSVALTRYTTKTLTNHLHLRKALAEVRETGIGTDNQEFMDGVVCVAVPIFTADKKCLGGLAISAPEARMTLETALTFVPKMRDAAEHFAKTFITEK